MILPCKPMSLYVLGEKVNSAIYGNWENPRRLVFMFSGNLESWVKIAGSMTKTAYPKDAYFFFNRPGYKGSSDLDLPLFLEAIPHFNKALREIALEAIEHRPLEIVNFGNSYGAFLMLADLVLNPSIREEHYWIMLDPFLPIESYKTLVPPFGQLLWWFGICIYQICCFLKQKKRGFFNGLIAWIGRKFLLWIEGAINFVSSLFGVPKTNLMEMCDIFDLMKDKKYSSSLNSINNVKLHVIGITSDGAESSSTNRFLKGLATYTEIRNSMEELAKKLSVYSNPFLTIDGTHNFLFSNEDRNILFRQVLDFAYTQRERVR